MMNMEKLDLHILQYHLAQLNLETVRDVPIYDLEWILSDFLLSWGQRLPLNTVDNYSGIERDRLRRFGLTVWPFSTAADFPTVQDDQLRTLALAAASLNLYVMLLDPIIDEPLTTPASVKLAIQSVLLHFYRTSNTIFAASAPFWSCVQQLLDEMSLTMLEEHQRSSVYVRPFSWNEFKHIARGKMSFARLNCVAMALLNGTPQRISTLTECWDAISLASIINDDTLDWQEDYQNANYTHLLCQVLFSLAFRNQVQDGHLPDLAEIGAAIFCMNLIESLNESAYDELAVAARRAAEMECSALAHLIHLIQNKLSSRFTNVFDRKMMSLIAAITEEA